jgi:hypothetical protein
VSVLIPERTIDAWVAIEIRRFLPTAIIWAPTPVSQGVPARGHLTPWDFFVQSNCHAHKVFAIETKSLGMTPSQSAPRGYVDLDIDQYKQYRAWAGLIFYVLPTPRDAAIRAIASAGTAGPRNPAQTVMPFVATWQTQVSSPPLSLRVFKLGTVNHLPASSCMSSVSNPKKKTLIGLNKDLSLSTEGIGTSGLGLALDQFLIRLASCHGAPNGAQAEAICRTAAEHLKGANNDMPVHDSAALARLTWVAVP